MRPRVPGSNVALGFALGLALWLAAAPAPAEESWATARAREQVHQGKQAALRGDTQAAAQSFIDALATDATYGDAYLELGRLRESLGDPREAARVYAMALEHIPGFVEAHLARSSLLARDGRRDEAIADLRQALAQRPRDLDVLGALVETSIRFQALPQALGYARRRKAIAIADGDRAVERQSLVTEIALVRMLDETDPVIAGKSETGVRALYARRAAAAARAQRPKK